MQWYRLADHWRRSASQSVNCNLMPEDGTDLQLREYISSKHKCSGESRLIIGGDLLLS